MKDLVVDGEEGFYFLPFSLLSEFQEFCKQNSSKNTPPPHPPAFSRLFGQASGLFCIQVLSVCLFLKGQLATFALILAFLCIAI